MQHSLISIATSADFLRVHYKKAHIPSSHDEPTLLGDAVQGMLYSEPT